LNELVFVGLGLHDEKGLSLHGLDEIKTADEAFIELYTSLLPGFSQERLEKLSGKRIQVLSRKEIEEENGRLVLEAAERGKTVLLVPGDPLIATTHITLRIEAEKLGVKTRIVHGASIISAAVGLSGLHSYKFGKSVTVPFPDETPSTTPYEVIRQNIELGLHTLCFLDIKAEKGRYLGIHDALKALLAIEERKKARIVTPNTLAVGIARAGSSKPVTKADYVRKLLSYDFGDPPHCMIFLGKLHFMEAEALIQFAKAPKKLRETTQ